MLLYGDAVAHINIARRVFDSKTPGLLQLGTVWLPLPHLLMIPFLISMKMWRSGAGGSIPSMVAYVFGVVGMFRLTRCALSGSNPPDAVARAAAWIAALIYAANPNLMYMQSTAMGEAVYLAFFIWAVVSFCEWIQRQSRSSYEMWPVPGGRVPDALRRMVPRRRRWPSVVLALTRPETWKSSPSGPRERHALNRGFSPRRSDQVSADHRRCSRSLARLQRDRLPQPARIRKWPVFREGDRTPEHRVPGIPGIPEVAILLWRACIS